MTDNKISREKTFSEELPYFKERIKEVFDYYDNPKGCAEMLYIDVLRDSNRVVRKAEEEINRQQAEYNNLLEQFRILDYECGRLEKADENQKAEIENLTYTLLGVMHSVDKWLDGTELEQDEVNRSATMREKTLRIVEEKQAEIERLKEESSDKERAYTDEYCLRKEWQDKCRQLLIEKQTAKSEAVKEFANKLKKHSRKMQSSDFSGDFWDEAVLVEDIDNLVIEMVGENNA